MAEPFVGEVKLVAFNYPPRGWAFCNGQILPISQNQALFALLGTMYGGDGQTTFALPNLQTRTAMHRNGEFPQGQPGGESEHTLTIAETPQHTHTLGVLATAADQINPATRILASSAGGALSAVYAAPSSPLDAPLDPSALLATEGNLPHNNMPPYLTVNFCIALTGIFPSHN